MSKPAYEITNRGFTVRGWYGPDDSPMGRIQITHETRGLVRDVPYLGYKIWNIAAHFNEIVDGLLDEAADDNCPRLRPAGPLGGGAGGQGEGEDGNQHRTGR